MDELQQTQYIDVTDKLIRTKQIGNRQTITHTIYM